MTLKCSLCGNDGTIHRLRDNSTVCDTCLKSCHDIELKDSLHVESVDTFNYDMIQKVLDQNNRILDINKELLRYLANPMYMLKKE